MRLKKITIFSLVLAIVFSFCACNYEESNLSGEKLLAKSEIDAYYEAKGRQNYTEENWAIILEIVTNGKTLINAATNKVALSTLVEMVKAQIDSIEVAYDANWKDFYKNSLEWGYKDSFSDFIATLLGKNGTMHDKFPQNITAYEVFIKNHPDYNNDESGWIKDMTEGRLFNKEFYYSQEYIEFLTEGLEYPTENNKWRVEEQYRPNSDLTYNLDLIIVALTKEATYSFRKYRPEDFPEIDCIEVIDMTMQWEASYVETNEGRKSINYFDRIEELLIYKQRKQLSTFENGYSEEFWTRYIDNFRRILYIKLPEKNKDKAVEAVSRIRMRDDLLTAALEIRDLDFNIRCPILHSSGEFFL